MSRMNCQTFLVCNGNVTSGCKFLSGWMTRSRRSPLYTRLRELLTEARIHSGLTQTELAVRLRRPQSFVAKYEGGERRLDVI